MWHCSRCGEAIEDNFDACWKCGARRDDAASEEFEEEPDDPSAPDTNSKLPADRTSGDEMTPEGPPERVLTQEGLAALLLRFLGLCFTAFGVVSLVTVVGRIFLLSTTYGLDDAVRRYYHLESMIAPGTELIIGIYFLIGGQWVYDRILTPIRRRFPDYSPDETEEVGPWRTWRSADGTYTEKAKFIAVTGGTVRLLKEDGSTITVERSKLSEDDWHWVTRHERTE